MVSQWPWCPSGHGVPVAMVSQWPWCPSGHGIIVAMVSQWCPSGHGAPEAMVSQWPWCPCLPYIPFYSLHPSSHVLCGCIYISKKFITSAIFQTIYWSRMYCKLMLLITIIFNLSKHFCVICKFQYVACYNHYHQTH